MSEPVNTYIDCPCVAPLTRWGASLRLQQWLPWLVLAVTLTATCYLWESARDNAVRSLQAEFDFRVRDATGRIDQRMKAYEQVLRGVDGFFTHADAISRDEFRNYFAQLKLTENYPGIRGLGYTQRLLAPAVDTGRKNTSSLAAASSADDANPTAVIMVEPFSERAARLLGYDMYAEPIRRVAMAQARDTGQAALSGAVRLASDTGDQAARAGIIYLPIYRHGAPHRTVAERRENIIGWVFAPFRMDDLMKGILGERGHELDIDIHDGEEVSPASLIYDSDSDSEGGPSATPRFKVVQRIAVAEHTWTVVFQSLADFDARLDTNRPTIIGIAGLGASLGLALLLGALVRGRAEALRAAERETRYRQMFENTAAIAYLFDPEEGRIVDANPAAVAFWGYTRDELRGMSIADINVASRDHLVEAWNAMLEGAVHRREMRHRLKNGEVREVEVMGSSLCYEGQTLIYVILYDITDRKRAELALARESGMNKMLLGVASDGIQLLDMDGNVIHVNDALCRLLGYSKAEIRAMNVATWDAQWSAQELLARLSVRLDDRGQTVVIETRYRHRDGHLIDVEISANSIELGGTPLLYVSARDITERKVIETKLNESRLRLESIIGTAMDAIITVDAESRILVFNKAAEAMFRCSASDVFGQCVDHFIPQRSRSGHRAHLKKFGDTGATARAMAQLGQVNGVRADGEEFPIEASISRIEVAGTKLYTIVLRDITERLAAERALRASEERWSFALEGSGEVVWDWNMETGTLLLSKHFGELFGFADGEIGNRVEDWAALLHADDRERALENLKAYSRDGTQSYADEYRVRCKGGDWKWILTRGMVVSRDAQGKPLRMIGTHADISERKRTEEELKLAGMVYQALGDAIMVTDADKRIIAINPAFTKLTGYSLSEIVGREPELLKSGHHDAAFYQRMVRSVETTGQWRGEIRNRHKDGEDSPVWMSVNSVYNESGELIRRIAMYSPVTEQKRAEEALMSAQEALLQAKQAAEAASRAKSDFLANMSHEIRTPLNGILGMTELALETQLTPEQREYLELVYSSADGLLGVINDVLDFSKVEADKLTLERIPFDLRKSLHDTVKTLALRAEQKGLYLRLEVAEGLPRFVLGDPSRLRQIVLNLVSNAIKFTTSGGIEVCVSALEDSANGLLVHFVIKDTGIGIAPEKHACLFDAFTQADTSISREYGGTGLGLAICVRLVKLMDGQIWLESEPGQGSSFFFNARFDHTGEQALPNTPLAATETSRLVAVAGSKKLRILLAEDNPVNQRFALTVLRNAGHDVVLACDGKMAVDRIAEGAGAFDVVLMDVQMPVMDGFEATRIMRRMGVTIPIIALTAHALAGFQAQSMAAGMTDYIAKPVQARALLDRLAALFGGTPTDDAPATEAASLSGAASQVDRQQSVADVVDIEKAMLMVGGDESLLGGLARLVVQQCEVDVPLLRMHAASRDAAQLKGVAHRLKGSLGSMAAGPAYTASQALDAAAHEGKPENYLAALALLELEMVRLLPVLRQIAQEPIVV